MIMQIKIKQCRNCVKVAVYCRSFIQNINNWGFRNWKNKCIIKFNKNPYEAKYQFLINKRESTGLSHFNDPKGFTEYSNHMQDAYKYIDEYNTDEKPKILIVFHVMIADTINNKKLNSIVTQQFIRDRKLNITLVFITQSYFKVSKDVRLTSTHFFIMKIPNQRELQEIALNHSSDLNSKDFNNIYKKYTTKPFFFLLMILRLHQIIL